MRSKRLLAFFLAFCMVFTALAGPASAVIAPEVGTVDVEKNTSEKVTANKSETSPNANGLLVSGEATKSGLSMRENPQLTVNVNDNNENSNEDKWTVTPADSKPTVSLLPTESSETLKELQEAAKLYSLDDIVCAFVVMEGKPLAETHTSRTQVSAEAEKDMLRKQDDVISEIERTLLKGEKLEVRYQFTYLTNAFTIMTAFGNLEQIAGMAGVKSVFLTPVFEPVTTAQPNTAAAGAMTGVHTVWEELGYTGTGMKIAIIDTGLDLDHPSFAADPETNDMSLTKQDITAVLTELNAYARRNIISADTLYRSAKVPFAFNYVDSNLTADHSSDDQGDHGTHVAGIAAANHLEGTSVVGMAPDAQIIVMKVFGNNGGAYMDDVAAALEDAMTLGCDVVNASLGSPRGFTTSNSEIDLIYERLESQNIVATFSAGNEGTSSYDNMWGTDLNRTQNPDNATIGSPSTWPGTLAIASAENCEIQTPFFTLADGEIVFFNNYSYSYYFGYSTGMAPLIGEELEYFMIDGLGYEEEFYDEEGNSLVEGKVALVLRGTLDFGMKIYNAELAGAVACIIVNHTPNSSILDDFIYTDRLTDEYGDEFYPGIPSCMINLEDGQKMVAAEVQTLIVSEATGARVVEGGQMSSFSSWGITPDLQLMPDIAGIGGNVYSTVDNGKYGVMSGTSMSAPQIAGVTALVMQHLYTIYPDAPDGTIRNLAEAILMSTADPIIGSDSGVEASPRQQGAGLVDAVEATTTTTYLTVAGGRPKAELGDSTNGKYTFSFEIHNIGKEDKTYTLDASLLTEAVAAAYGEFFMYGMDMALSGDVKFNKNTVTVPAGGRANVTVSIALSDEDKAYFAQCWENGGYVEGYVYLYNEEGAAELNLPFLGFYGDWTDAPIFDTGYWYDNGFWGLAPKNGLAEADEYYHVLWTSLMGTDWVLGMNPYSGAQIDDQGNIAYDPAHNVVSPNGDGVIDGIEEIYLSLLRNAKTLTFTYTVDGQVMHQEIIENAPKTMYISSYGQVIPFIHSWYGWDLYDFTGKDGKVLPNGTEVLLTIDGYVDYGTGGDHSIQIPITVDTEKPELVRVYELPQAQDQDLIFFELTENVAPAAVVLMNPSGSRMLAQEYSFVETGNGTYIVGFDITSMGTQFMVALCDYAGNEAYYDVVYTADPDGNLPEMDTSVLYGYRLYDDHLLSDHMYGWISTNKPVDGDYASISALTDDYMEYAAITAAEYAGGKVFAVDAVYNFVVMDPGLWNTTTICNLGVAVMDMAFDDTTDTMYLLVKDEWYESYLYTVDLLTGEMSEVVGFGDYSYGPWAITFDAEGTLYAIQAYSSNLFTVDLETGEMTAVTDAEGNIFVMTDDSGAELVPSNHSQSIAYSEADNTIYWAHFEYGWWSSASGMAAVNLDDLTVTYSPYTAQAYNSDNQLVDYYPATEIVGLMVLEETEYTLPDADALNGILLNAENLILTVGQSYRLKASANPWNYELGEVTWTSSDESVVSVSGGEITAVGGGSAVVTATVGELSAECVIQVVDISGNVYAYNYYSEDDYYGYMIDIDLGTMNYTLIDESAADFLAGEYNGHDGCYYGYTDGGQFWRMDMTTGETVALGTPLGIVPTDMAYDYANGLMYALTFDSNNAVAVLNAVNLSNGQLIEQGYMYDTMLMTLACDLEGNIYAIDYSGYMMQLVIEDGMMDGLFVMEDLGELSYSQSMCYDFENDVIIWANPESAQMFWIDVKAEDPYALAIGNPVGGSFQFVGLFTVPTEMPALAEVAVESVAADDIMILTGTTKVPSTTVLPLNATSQTFDWTSSDASIVKVNADGTLTGVAAGVATVSGVLTDAVSGETFDVSFQVTVITAADNLYAHVMSDMATYSGFYWARLYPTLTSSPDVLGNTNHVMYAGEYYNGKLYAFGYDPDIWDAASWSLFIMDPVTQTIEKQILQDESFPFVYDMTYDYNTSTMYAVAGPSEYDADLYVVNMETGELTLLMKTSEFFMSIAAGPDGKLYAMENSQLGVIGEDDWGEIYGYGNAKLYTIDPIAKEIQLVGDTGMQSNMIASMTYDYDTDMLYWSPVFRADFFSAVNTSLAIVNPETAQGYNLGMVGVGGAQLSGMYVISDNFPAEPDPTLLSVIVAPANVDLVAGQTAELKAITIPMNIGAETTWSSSNLDVATVDENGVITAVSQGVAYISVTASLDGVEKTSECRVAVLAKNAAFLTYNITDGGWAEISRADGQIVTNLTEGEEMAVAAIANVDGDIYGYDVENTLFKLNQETYEREIIGQIDSAKWIGDWLRGFGYSEEMIDEITETMCFEVRDMDYDAANDRLLILGNIYDAWYGEMSSGNALYEVNLTDGSLKCLYTFHEHCYIMGMAVDNEGMVYIYNAYDDYYASVDLETEVVHNIISLQSQSYYGDYENDHALYFDEITGKLYHLFTANGSFYRLFSVDPTIGTITLESEFVGEVVYDDFTWSYIADCFAGLSFVDADDTTAPVELSVKWVAGSVSLDGAVGLNFFANLSDGVVNDPSTFVRFTYAGKTVDVPMGDAVASVKDGQIRYRFSCQVFARYFGETVTAQVMNENGPIGNAATYSVVQYCKNMIGKSANAELVALCKAMLNYGAAAQVIFNYNVENLANACLSEADKVLPDVDASAFARSKTGAEPGISVKSATLILESEVIIRVTFQLEEGYDISDYTFTINGEKVEPKQTAEGYCVETAGIAAKNLEQMYTFQVGGLTANYGALSYVNSKLSSSNPDMVNMVKALYAYYAAAEAYFAE